MKILHVIPHHPSPSGFVFAKRQVKDLELEGHENDIFFFDTKISLRSFWSQHSEFKKRIAAFQPDVVHAHYGTFTGFFASLSHRIPFVITFQGSDIHQTQDIHPLREKLGKWMSKKAADKAKGIICVSQKMLEQLPKGKEKAYVIPCGIDIRVFQPLDKTQCQHVLGLNVEKRFIFFNANNPKVKRLDIAQAAIQLLQEKFPAELLSLNGNVHPDEIPTYINSCDAVLLCSDSEGSPMIIKEALACEIPIVSVAVGDVAERINGVKNCFIVPQEIDAIHKQLESILDKEPQYTNGREKLKADELDSITTIRKIIHVYQKAIQD
jgi:teichuronic acid biosynthesis glycosyltransferase TuaC